MVAGGFSRQRLKISPNYIKFAQRKITAEVTWTVRQTFRCRSDQQQLPFLFFGDQPQGYARIYLNREAEQA